MRRLHMRNSPQDYPQNGVDCGYNIDSKVRLIYDRSLPFLACQLTRNIQVQVPRRRSCLFN